MRYPQSKAPKGSQKWIQHLINDQPDFFNSMIQSRLPGYDTMAFSVCTGRLWESALTIQKMKTGLPSNLIQHGIVEHFIDTTAIR